MLGSGDEIGVDGLDVTRIRLTAPADHEALNDRVGLIDLLLRNHGLAETACSLSDEGQRHDRHVREVLASGVIVDVEQLLKTPGGGEHRDR